VRIFHDWLFETLGAEREQTSSGGHSQQVLEDAKSQAA
jgi:hypothetical protein